MIGTPQTMMKNTTYDHLSSDLIHYFTTNISKAKQAGIIDIIIDPGFGFSKTIEQNYQLLNQVEQLNALDTPMLIGVSRKSMIYKALDITPNEALNGTTALHMIALSKGAQLLRVHDVKPAVECIKLYQLLKNS
jgi:dihydropteroate synthase